MPIRIQRKRTKGWKMPEGTVNCTRPGRYGNQFRIGRWYAIGIGNFAYLEAAKGHQDKRFTKIETAEQAVEWFRRYRDLYPLRSEELAELRGKDLACFCALDQPCHVDVLLELANLPTSSPAQPEGQDLASGKEAR